MSIPISGNPVSHVDTLKYQQGEEKKAKEKVKDDKAKDIEHKKAAATKQKVDAKTHEHFVRTLQTFGPRIDKKFDLALKSHLGGKPVLSPFKKEVEGNDTKVTSEDDQEQEADNQSTSKSTDKLSSTSTSNAAIAKEKKVKNQGATKATKAKGQAITPEASQKAKSSKKAKEVNNKDVKPNEDTITTIKEMDEFISEIHQDVAKFQETIKNAYGKEIYGKKDQTNDANKSGKATVATTVEDLAGKTNHKDFPNKSGVASSDHKEAAKLKGSNDRSSVTSNQSMIGDDDTRATKSGGTQANADVPEHIKSALRHSMALKGNIQNIANNASLQSLIASHLDTRGSYSIKIFLAMYKLKKGKAKTTSANLSDAQKTRSLVSDRQILTVKKEQEKAEEAEEKQKTMGIIGLVASIVALIVSIALAVCTAGAGAALVVAVIAVLASAGGVAIASANLTQKEVDGEEMGGFNAFVYHCLRHFGVSEKDAKKDTPYVSMAVQAVLILVTFGAGIAGAGGAASAAAETATEEAANAAKKLLQSAMNLIAKYGADATRVVTKASGLIEGGLGLTSAGYGINKAELDEETTDLQAKVVETQAKFEKIEQNEDMYKELMLRNIKRLSEEVSNIARILDSEYQAIKLLNTKSKVA